MIETDDLVVLVLGAPGPPGQPSGRIEGITRLEKLIFLIEQERKPKWLTEDVGFESNRVRPVLVEDLHRSRHAFSSGTARRLGVIHDITRRRVGDGESIIGEQTPYATRNFELTDLGRRYYQALLNELPEGVEDDLSNFKKSFGAMPLRRLVRYVYERHPGFTDKSIIRDDVLY